MGVNPTGDATSLQRARWEREGRFGGTVPGGGGYYLGTLIRLLLGAIVLVVLGALVASCGDGSSSPATPTRITTPIPSRPSASARGGTPTADLFLFLAVDRLNPGQRLDAGQQLVSPTGGYMLVMQRDGNLVLYAPDRQVRWATYTAGKPGTLLLLQEDGNFILDAPGDRAHWTSNTAGNTGSVLILQGDGNLVLYAPDGRAIWWSNR